jgi:nitroreductase
MNAIKDLKAALDWRYATKKMDPTKKISDENWSALKDSLRLSPSSYGIQPWKFIVVQNPELRSKLRAASWGQSQVEDCSHFVVFTTLKKITPTYLENFARSTAKAWGKDYSAVEAYYNFMVQNIVDGKPVETHLSWNQRNTYISMGFLLEAAALLKIDCVAMEGIEPANYDTILGLENSEYTSVAAVALGYRHAEDAHQYNSKSRFDESIVFDIRK